MNVIILFNERNSEPISSVIPIITQLIKELSKTKINDDLTIADFKFSLVENI